MIVIAMVFAIVLYMRLVINLLEFIFISNMRMTILVLVFDTCLDIAKKMGDMLVVTTIF